MPRRLRADVALRGAAYVAAPLALAAGWLDRVASGAAVSRDGDARPLGHPRRLHRAGRGAGAAAGRQPARLRRLRRRDVRAGARAPRGWCSNGPARSRRAAPTSRGGRSRSAPTRRRSRSCPTASTPRASGRSRDGAPTIRAAPRHPRRRAARVHRRTARPQEGLRAPDRRLGARRDQRRRDPGDRRRRRPRATSCASARRAAGRRRSRPLPRQPVAGRRRRATSPRPTSWSCPSVRDDSGNVDGLPNIVLEALAAGHAGGRDDGRRHRHGRRATSGPGWSCPNGDPDAIADAVSGLLRDPAVRSSARRGGRGRWSRRVSAGDAAAARFEAAYRPRACLQVAHGDNISRSSDAHLRAARKPGLSMFFPAYNDSGTIASLVIAALRTARKLTPDYEVIVVNDGSADGDRRDPRRARPHLPAGPRGPPREEPRLRRRAAQRLRGGHARAGLLHRRRRAVRSGRDGSAVAARSTTRSTWSTATRSAARIRCTASSSAASITTPSSCSSA